MVEVVDDVLPARSVTLLISIWNSPSVLSNKSKFNLVPTTETLLISYPDTAEPEEIEISLNAFAKSDVMLSFKSASILTIL